MLLQRIGRQRLLTLDTHLAIKQSPNDFVQNTKVILNRLLLQKQHRGIYLYGSTLRALANPDAPANSDLAKTDMDMIIHVYEGDDFDYFRHQVVFYIRFIFNNTGIV